MIPVIDKIDILFVSFALRKPYKLSFKDIEAFDSVFSVIYCEDCIGLGETTPLFGYNMEHVNSVSEELFKVCPTLIGEHIERAIQSVKKLQRRAPFAMTSLLSAFDSMKLDLNAYQRKSEIKIIENIDMSDQGISSCELEEALKSGYTNFKVKIGRCIDKEINILNNLIKSVPKNIKFRVDANKALTYGDAVKFTEKLEFPEKIEHIEQPFVEANWQKHMDLRNETGFPIAFDESIYWDEDLVKIRDVKGGITIKLKLMKHGGINDTFTLGQKAKQMGFDVIIGNGVQTDWGCLLETIVYDMLDLRTAGEMVGFLKQRAPLIPDWCEVTNGTLVRSDKPSDISEIASRLYKMKPTVETFCKGKR